MLVPLLIFLNPCVGMRPEGEARLNVANTSDATPNDAISQASAIAQTNRTSLAESVAAVGAIDQILTAVTEDPTAFNSEELIAAVKAVILMIEENLYTEMDAFHQADVESLAEVANGVSDCNGQLAESRSDTGGSGLLRKKGLNTQELYDSHEETTSQTRAAKAAARAAFDAHMKQIKPPAHFSLPVGAVESAWTDYFDTAPDLTWFERERALFSQKKADAQAADDDLQTAEAHLAETKGQLEAHFCDLKDRLAEDCITLDECVSDALAALEVAKEKAQASAKLRKDSYAASQSTIQHLRKLVNVTGPEGVVSRYELTNPTPPEKVECESSDLNDERWEAWLSCEEPASCKAWYESGHTSNGVYTISVVDEHGETAQVDVYCDMDNGGWTLVGQMNGFQEVKDTWLRSYHDEAALQTPDIPGTWASIPAVDLAVNHATRVRLSNSDISSYVWWTMDEHRTLATWWNRAAGWADVFASTQSKVVVYNERSVESQCYQNAYGISPLGPHGGPYPATTYNTHGNTAGNDLCMGVGVTRGGSDGFSNNLNGYDAPKNETDWPNVNYHVQPHVSVWLN